jgi:hypothetical protein
MARVEGETTAAKEKTMHPAKKLAERTAPSTTARGLSHKQAVKNTHLM